MEAPMTEIGPTLIALAMPAMAAALLGVATVLAVRRRGVRRLYWVGCAMLIGVGSASTITVVCCAPPTVMSDGSISGEMPPAFGAALMLATIGCGGALLGLVGVICGRRGGTGAAGPK